MGGPALMLARDSGDGIMERGRVSGHFYGLLICPSIYVFDKSASEKRNQEALFVGIAEGRWNRV